MGVCTNGDIQISLQSEKDAEYVFDQLEEITRLVTERIGQPAHFDLQDIHTEGTIFYCNVFSNRTPNGEFQVKEVINQVKLMVKQGQIKPPVALQAELLVQHEGWYIDEDEFKEELDE